MVILKNWNHSFAFRNVRFFGLEIDLYTFFFSDNFKFEHIRFKKNELFCSFAENSV